MGKCACGGGDIGKTTRETFVSQETFERIRNELVLLVLLLKMFLACFLLVSCLFLRTKQLIYTTCTVQICMEMTGYEVCLKIGTFMVCLAHLQGCFLVFPSRNSQVGNLQSQVTAVLSSLHSPRTPPRQCSCDLGA